MTAPGRDLWLESEEEIVDMREYAVRAQSTDTFGRVLCSCRTHHFVVDGPIHNGCPGEELTPAELFLGGIAACGVELMHVIAKERKLTLSHVGATVTGQIDPTKPLRQDVTLFNRIRVRLELTGVDESQAVEIVEGFKRR